MDVTIIEKESGKIVVTYPINIKGMNYTPSKEEYYSDAWRCAVDDRVVADDARDKYVFRLGN
jgi:hypothetical protein